MNQDEHIGLRLKEWISVREIPAIAFAEQVGIQRSALSHIFSGRNKPSVDVLYKMKTTFPEIDLEWLITGIPRDKSGVEKSVITANDSGLSNEVITDVTLSDVSADIQDNIGTSESKQVIDSNHVKLIRIIELYSDQSFKSYDL
jgi:transcriptional regulator with XRE-family HTH domain